ncbi:odorant receptor 4-like [Odontomachus brunneus]|uniref:odorant receptor 4-like n=1 Tax=Odontomachus brunneus TaxID=486640 RepID=UPI0013F265BB|nr:odorant receptor 4-like [Odontomachus brunneus]
MESKSTVHRTTKLVFTLFGIWPGMSYVLICRIYWFIILMSDEIWLYRYFQSHFQLENLPNLVDCLSAFMAHMKVLTKLFVFWFNQQKFVEILTMMTEDWSECADNDNDLRETACKAKLSGRITVAMLVLHVFNAITFCINVFLAVSDVDIDDSDFELPFFLKVEFPMRISSLRTYKVMLSVQFVNLLFIIIGTGMVNALLLTLVLHVGGQINILCAWLNKLAPKKNEGTDKLVVVMINKIIRKHQRIIQFSTHIEDLYRYISFVLFATNTTMICMLAFLVLTSLNSPDATERVLGSLLFYTITNLESFIFCFAGEYLRNKSKTIGGAAYNSTWYDLRPKDSRVLLFVILRAKKQLSLTAGKMMDLSLESFGNIMKASASYMSVLLAMQ